jgi:hypothetical protein
MKLQQYLSGIILLFSLYNLSAQTTDPEALKSHVRFLAGNDLMGRGFGSEQGLQAAEYIKAEFEKAGIRPFGENFFYPFYHRMGVVNIKGRNVVGFIEGNDPVLKNEYIVLGAHYDHIGWNTKDKDTLIFNGADDNASGVSGIIEIGKILVKNQDQLKRSFIIVAFDGEESGLVGSHKMMSDSIFNSLNIKAMFSLDMIGMYSANDGLDLEGIEQLKDYTIFLNEAKSKEEIKISKTSSKLAKRTDTAPFGNAGIPAVHFFTGLKSPYHKPEDVDSLLDYEGMAKVTNFTSELCISMATAENLVADIPVTEKISPKKKMQRFHLGIITKNGGSHFNYRDDYFRSKPIYAFSGGVFMQARLSQMISLQPEFLYETFGGQQSEGNLRANALSVPLSILITTPDPGNNGFRFFVQAGGYYSSLLSVKLNDVELEKEKDQFGIIWGAGFEIKKFRIAYQHKGGVMEILKPESLGYESMRMAGSSFVLGVTF